MAHFTACNSLPRMGRVIHKIYITEQSDREVYSALVKKYTTSDGGLCRDLDKHVQKFKRLMSLMVC